MPSKEKPLKLMSVNALSHTVGYFSLRDGFSKLRLINKKFNKCFEEYIFNKAFNLDNSIKQYSDENVKNVENEIKNNLTIIDRINLLGPRVRIFKFASDLHCNKLLDCLIAILGGAEDPIILHGSEGEVQFMNEFSN